jgi:tetratricopeptide (TPR) repeat protein
MLSKSSSELVGPSLTKSSIIAVHGLGANPDTTWLSDEVKDGGKTTRRVHWLKDQDMLPSLIPNARIWAFCYNSNWLGEAPVQRIESIAEHLLALIHQNRPEGCKKPIIFVAHSFGGIVLEAALTAPSITGQYAHILKVTTGIVFLGTPFRGSPSIQQARVIADGAKVLGYKSSKSLLDDLLPSSEKLTDLLVKFTKMTMDSHLRVVCFYEQLPTSILRIRHLGPISRATERIIVPKAQAVLEVHPALGLGASHTKMNEFSGPSDNNYKLVAGQICQIEKNSQSILRQKSQPSEETISNIPYLRNPDFVGRESLFWQLDAILSQRKRAALYGLGGIGKSQIAIEYAHKVRETGQSVFWVQGNSRERFEQSFMALADLAGLSWEASQTKDSMAFVKHWMEQNDKKWLLIIDNADIRELFSTETPNPDGSLSDYLPKSKTGSILITSRDRKLCVDIAGARSSVSVKELDVNDCRDLLRKSLSTEIYEAADVKPLIKLLHQIPLALSQAAAFMEQNNLPASKYIEMFQESEDLQVDLLNEHFEAFGRDNDSYNAINKTWQMAMWQIYEQQKYAAHLLILMAFFDKQAIPKELLYHHELTKLEFEKALGTLQAFSLIALGASDTYNMHSLVQVCTRSWVFKAWDPPGLMRELIFIFADAKPLEGFTRDQIFARYLPHMEAVLGHSEHIAAPSEQEGVVLQNLGDYFYNHQNYAQAEFYLLRSVRVLQETCEEGNFMAYWAMSALARTYSEQGRLAEAVSMEETIMKVLRENLGDDNSNTLDAMSVLAMSYLNQGRLREAADLQTEVLELTKKSLGDDDRDTLYRTGDLATIMKNQGKIKEAEDLQRQTLEKMVKVLGEDDALTLMLRINLANTLTFQGKFEEAVIIQRQLFEIELETLGESNLGTLKTMINLAGTLNSLGELDEAESLAQRVVSKRQEIYGSDHSETLSSVYTLACVYESKGRLDEAEQMFVRAIAGTEKALGPNHIYTCDYKLSYAKLLYRQKRYQEAEVMFDEAQKGYTATAGPEHKGAIQSGAGLEATRYYLADGDQDSGSDNEQDEKSGEAAAENSVADATNDSAEGSTGVIAGSDPDEGTVYTYVKGNVTTTARVFPDGRVYLKATIMSEPTEETD